jgi:hypothetical protein
VVLEVTLSSSNSIVMDYRESTIQFWQSTPSKLRSTILLPMLTMLLATLLAAILGRATSTTRLAARAVNLDISVQNSNTQLRHGEVESTLLVGRDDLRVGRHNVVALERVVVLVRVAAGVGENGQGGLGATLDSVELDGDGLVRAVGRVVARTLPDESIAGFVLAGAVPHWAVGADCGEGLGDRVVGEERPDVPAGGAGGDSRVGSELDEGDGPLPAVHVAQDGSIKGCWDAVGVALVSNEGGCLADTADPPWEVVEATFPAGTVVDVSCSNFTNDVAIVVVEAVELVDELIGLTVGVVVAKDAFGVCDGVGGIAEFESDRVNSARITRGSRSNDLDVGVCLRDGVVEHLETVLLVRLPAIRVSGQPIFVANLDVVKSVRLGVAKLSTACAPFGVCGPLDEFDLLQAVLDPGLKFGRSGEVAVEGKTSVATDDWTCVLVMYH